MLHTIGGWAAADLRAWPKEHQRVRILLVLAGLEAAVIGWIAVALVGTPGDVSTPGRLESGSSLWFALGLVAVLFLSGAPLALYARFVRSLSASVLTGLALVALIVFGFDHLLTSSSPRAGQAILFPFFVNYYVVWAGQGLDRVLRWLGRVHPLEQADLARFARPESAEPFFARSWR